MEKVNVKSAIAFVESLSLGNTSGLATAATESLGDAVKTDGSEDAVVVGSQIVEFAEQLNTNVRQHVSNTFLLAKLTADLEVQNTNSKSNWYPKYYETLTRTGWTIEAADGATRTFKETNLEVHKQIIPFLTLYFGPAISSASLILELLKNLDEMDADTPWITLFQRTTQQVTANQFMVSYIGANSDNQPTMKLAQFELVGKKDISQLLFFKLQETSISLSSLSKTFSANEALFEQLKDVVRDKVDEFTVDHVRAIDLSELRS